LLIMILLTLAFAFIMSTWGWNKITGPLWKLGSGWQGSVANMEDEETLLPSMDVCPSGEMQTQKGPSGRSAEEIVRAEGSEEGSSDEDIYG
jgi:hypothetical protein